MKTFSFAGRQAEFEGVNEGRSNGGIQRDHGIEWRILVFDGQPEEMLRMEQDITKEIPAIRIAREALDITGHGVVRGQLALREVKVRSHVRTFAFWQAVGVTLRARVVKECGLCVVPERPR